MFQGYFILLNGFCYYYPTHRATATLWPKVWTKCMTCRLCFWHPCFTPEAQQSPGKSSTVPTPIQLHLLQMQRPMMRNMVLLLLLNYWSDGRQSWAWALKKSLMRPSFFSIIVYFREIRNKLSHWPGCQSAQRLYNSYNLCPCARPSHVGKCWPGPEFKFSKAVEVWWSC